MVNLAGGLTVYKPSAEVTLEEWTREVNNNLLSAFLVTREAFPHMAKTRRRLDHQLRARRRRSQHACL